MEGFIFGSNTPWTYDQLQRKRAVAESLLAGAGAAPRNVGEGLNAIGKALAYRGLEKRASKEEARLRGEFDAKWGTAFGGMPGMGGAAGGAAGGGGSPSGTWTPAPPAPKPTESFMGKGDVADGGLSYGLPAADAGVASGGLDYGANVMTPQEMLIAGAKARGLDPIDVATAISYETGGKFDPTIKGPTTQWGTHEGLIQFGDPQGQEHGAVFDQGADAAWRSQLDPTNGAVWSYLDSVGVKPGMGLDQIYSGINAGGVDRMGASDANNGGAPGTVADKVAGMGDHRVKAAEFLGGTWTPTEGGGAGGGVPQMDMASLAALAGDPMASPQQKAIVEALIAQQLQGMDPLRQLEMEKAQLELAQMKDPGQAQPEELTDRMALLTAAGVDPASPEGKNYLLTGELPTAGGGGTEYGLTPQYGTDKDGNLVAIQFAKDGTSIATPLPEGVAITKGIDKLDLGDSFQYVNTMTGEKIGDPVPKNLEAAAAATAGGKALGEDTALLESTSSKMEGLETVVSELESLADKATYTWAGQMRDAVGKQFGADPGAGAVARSEYIAKVDNQVLPMLRDTFGAAFTVKEGETLRATLGDPDKSPAEKKAVLRAFIEQKKRDIKALETRTGKPAAATAPGAVPEGIDPADWEFMTPEGKALFQ